LALGSALSLARHYFDPEYSKTRGWRELARSMQIAAADVRPDEVRLTQNYPDPVLWYYTGPTAHLVLPPDALDEPGTRREIQALVDAGVTRVVLAEQPVVGYDDRQIATTALSESYSQVASNRVGDWYVQTYVRAPEAPGNIGADFADGVTVEGASLQNEALTPGGLLVTFLDWGGDPARLAGSEKLTLQLLDDTGTLVAQTDVPFGREDVEGDARPYAVRVPWRLPAGSYRLIAGIYDPAQAGAPRLLTTAGADHVELGVLTAAAAPQ
jgi:hypothetical protein